jgi:hypothetical protein
MLSVIAWPTTILLLGVLFLLIFGPPLRAYMRTSTALARHADQEAARTTKLLELQYEEEADLRAAKIAAETARYELQEQQDKTAAEVIKNTGKEQTEASAQVILAEAAATAAMAKQRLRVGLAGEELDGLLQRWKRYFADQGMGDGLWTFKEFLEAAVSQGLTVHGLAELSQTSEATDAPPSAPQ